MDRQPERSEKKARSGERLIVQCSLAIANGIQVGEGWVFDVSMRGCLVESHIRVSVGDRLQLRLGFPEASPVPFICVSVAIVRWTEGHRFGVEFIKMDEKYLAYLHRFITNHSDPWARAYG
jgi:Na+-transporting NADH:ubiquinone oxidoreductase subunit NqrF